MHLNQTLAELNTSMGNLSGLMISLLIIIVVTIIIILVGYFIYWLKFKKEGTYVQPFGIGICNEKYDGRAISDLLVSELYRIRQIHELNLPGIELQTKENLAFLTVAPSSENPKYEITNVNITGGSFALTLGLILLVLKRLIGHPGNTIAGSVQRYGSEIKLVAWMGPERTGAWQAGRDDENLPYLIKDVAFMIAKDISEEKIQAKTWQAFKFFTEARYCYHQYILTEDKEQLKCSKENCLMGLDYEKDYEDIHILLLNLAMAYERQ